MSSPIAINRPVSPASSSAGSSYTSSSSLSSTSSTSNVLVYSREELLNLAKSPLAQSYTPQLATLSAFPQLLRTSRRAPAEAAFRTLRHDRSTSSSTAGVPIWHMDAHVPSLRRAQSPRESHRKRSFTETRNRRSKEADSISWRRTGP